MISQAKFKAYWNSRVHLLHLTLSLGILETLPGHEGCGLGSFLLVTDVISLTAKFEIWNGISLADVNVYVISLCWTYDVA